MTKKSSLAAFFLEWAAYKGWQVPAIHLLICNFLEDCGELALLMVFRGAGKSTTLAIYNAWRYWNNPALRILHQGDQDKTAYKTSRDTKAILQHHPWTREWAAGHIRGESQFWWVPGAQDERNPSMQAAGILSGITSSRADEVQNDDVEVMKNIVTPEAREGLRHRLGEQTHIAVPGARFLYIGTPHTHDSLYDEIKAMGAKKLIIPMFAKEYRVEDATVRRYAVPFVPEVVFCGIGEHARLLEAGRDYKLTTSGVEFAAPPGGLVDFYAGAAWPEYFTPKEMLSRRQKTRTINYWDSQYQLHSKPTHEVRLNPDRMRPYDVEPVFREMNGHMTMWLGKVQIVSASVRWDPSGGKLGSDVSALCVILQSEIGNIFWHRAIALQGEIATFDDGGRIVGGQVWQICDVVEKLRLPRVVVENNGVGTHAPGLLKGALKARKIHCGVKDMPTTGNKNLKILGAFEPPLSGGYLWAHTSVFDQVEEKMRSWNPAVTQQPDDELDAAAAAMADEPVRIGRLVGNQTGRPLDDWRPGTGVFEVELSSG